MIVIQETYDVVNTYIEPEVISRCRKHMRDRVLDRIAQASRLPFHEAITKIAQWKEFQNPARSEPPSPFDDERTTLITLCYLDIK